MSGTGQGWVMGGRSGEKVWAFEVQQCHEAVGFSGMGLCVWIGGQESCLGYGIVVPRRLEERG